MTNGRPTMTDQTIQLDAQAYEKFRALILRRSGLHFREKRRRDLERGLQRAFARSGCPDLEGYYRCLADSPTHGAAWEQMIYQVTVGETHFFRNRPQFEALQRHILPEIVKRKRSLSRCLRIWSAGCATGEEPYSIAILLRGLVADLDAWNISILATDINREALARAQAGLYGEWSFREQGREGLRERYFTRQDKQWELAPEVRGMVSFAYLNLVEDTYPSLASNTVAFDLILCRNVTIYFTPEITQGVVDRLHEALVEGGWLVVGHSEPSPGTYDRFEQHNFPGAVLYRKPGTPARFDFSWLEKAERTAATDLDRPAPAPTPLPTKKETTPVLPAVHPTPPRPHPVEGRQRTTPSAQPHTRETTAGPAGRCAEAETLLEQGRAEQALLQLQQLLQDEPGCARAYYLVARIRANAGLWEEARRWSERALALDSLLPEAHFLLALVHGQEGDLGEALAAMKRVVYLDRRSALGHFCLANLYRDLGDLTRARKSWQNAARLLRAMPAESPLPWSDGMTAGRLRQLVDQYQLEER